MDRHLVRVTLAMVFLLGARVQDADGWHAVGITAFIALALTGLLALLDVIEERIQRRWREWRASRT